MKRKRILPNHLSFLHREDYDNIVIELLKQLKISLIVRASTAIRYRRFLRFDINFSKESISRQRARFNRSLPFVFAFHILLL